MSRMGKNLDFGDSNQRRKSNYCFRRLQICLEVDFDFLDRNQAQYDLRLYKEKIVKRKIVLKKIESHAESLGVKNAWKSHILFQ